MIVNYEKQKLNWLKAVLAENEKQGSGWPSNYKETRSLFQDGVPILPNLIYRPCHVSRSY